MYEKLSPKQKDRFQRGVCLSCGGKSEGKKLCATHMEQQSKTSRKIYAELRKKVLDHYGGRCSCCNESNYSFLTMDHVGDNVLGEITGTSFYLRIIKDGFPLDLQTLCYNCNRGKYNNNGVCPHKGTGIPKPYKRRNGIRMTPKNIAQRKSIKKLDL